MRLVSGTGGPYGTASCVPRFRPACCYLRVLTSDCGVWVDSADSWRARVSHICELQVNLASGAMTIDFGGMDRWDYEERVRNLEEAVRPL